MPPMWAWNRSSASMLWRRSLASKLNAAGAEAAGAQDRRSIASVSSSTVVRELVGVPAEQRVAAVGVDRAEHARCAAATAISCWKVWPASVAWLASMLNLTSLLEAVAAQEGVDRGDVEVVLVLGRLLRLGLDQERALEADLVLVLDHQVQEAAELVVLAPQVGVEQRVVALAAAPEHVVLAAELAW